MGVFTAPTEAEVKVFVRAHGVGELAAWHGIPAGSVNSNFAVEAGGARFFLRIYEEQDAAGAAREARLLAHLAARGVPVAPPLPLAVGVAPVLAGKPAALFSWRAGGMRCQASVSREDAARVGAALAHVHLAGDGAELAPSRFGIPELRARLRTIALAPTAEHASQAEPLGAALDALEPDLAAHAGSTGLVHGDLFRDNVLWSDHGAISALLDFESASRGSLAYDVMTTMLAWCWGDELELELARALVAGYVAVRPLTGADRAALAPQGRLAALRFTVTRLTDYAMRTNAVGERVVKDWRRFRARHRALTEVGDDLPRVLGVA